jgi:hypothetical protein
MATINAAVDGIILTADSSATLSLATSGVIRATIDSSGNLNFAGTAQRITGDMSNATIANRLAFQNSVTNGNTVVTAIPNGTGTIARYELCNNSDPTNSSVAQISANGSTGIEFAAAIKGTGSYLPMTFYTGGSERVRIDTSGNVGIGKTPTAGRLLDVNGDAWLNGARVGIGPGAITTNTVIGVAALNANTTGYQNTAVGYTALEKNTTGVANTAVGVNALQENTTAVSNTALGQQALQKTTTGSNNTGLGMYALALNTTGTMNTASGYAASLYQTTANYNSAHGAYSLHYCTTGSANTASGYYSLLSCTTGGNNTASGYYAGYAITTGSHNVLYGQQAGYYFIGITTGAGNICIGNYSDVSAANSNYEIVIGYATQGKGSSTGFINPYNGGGVYQGNNSSSWSTTSDRRLKKNIVDNNDGLAKINQLRVRNFEYRTEDEVDPELPKSSVIKVPGVQLGVIAQEIQEVLPECVKEESTGVLSVNSDRLIWHLVNAVKELSAEVNALKAKLGE